MINWILIVSALVGAVLGTEINRRRMKREGTQMSFLPDWEQRLYTFFAALAVVLSIETGRLALEQPSRESAFCFIIAVVFMTIVSLTHHHRDQVTSHREITRLKQG